MDDAAPYSLSLLVANICDAVKLLPKETFDSIITVALQDEVLMACKQNDAGKIFSVTDHHVFIPQNFSTPANNFSIRYLPLNLFSNVFCATDVLEPEIGWKVSVATKRRKSRHWREKK